MKEHLNNSALAPGGLLAIGAALWKALGHWSNIDFLFTMKEERFNLIFDFLLHTGWWIAVLIGTVWVVSEYRKGPADPESQQSSVWLITSCTIVAFLMGIYFTARGASGVPRVLSSWSTQKDGCLAMLDTSRMKGFRNDYNAAVICGISNPSIDNLENPVVTVSAPFEITGGGLGIMAPYSSNMRMIFQKLPKDVPDPAKHVNVWFQPVIIPKRVPTSKIENLGDVRRLGGKILTEEYYQQ